MKTRLAFTAILILAVSYVNGQDTQCTTPNGGIGICKDINLCPDLRQKANEFKTAPVATKLIIQTELQQRRCGTNFMVCCSDCLTPDNKDGIITHIRNCSHLWNLFLGRTTEGLQYITLSRMDVATLDVCCGPPPPQKTSPAPASVSRSGGTDCDDKIALPPSPDSQCCGIQLFADSRIVGGNITDIYEHPWMVLLEYESNGKINTYCGGSLITSTHVITAAHCITSGNAWPPKNARVGEWNTKNPGQDCDVLPDGRKQCNDGAISVPIDSILVHPKYKTDRREDIAIVKLSRPVQYTDFVRPICLPTTQHGEGRKLLASGWGSNMTHKATDFKMVVELNLTSQGYCGEKYRGRRIVTERQVCALGERGKDSCKGDSGGPLMTEVEHPDNHFELVGVVNSGPSICGSTGVPGIYANVYAYLDWINENVRERKGNWITP